MRHLKAPKWCPEAIATNRGWEHPKTKELLISLRGLKNLIEKNTPKKIIKTLLLEIDESKTAIESKVSIEIETPVIESKTAIEVETSVIESKVVLEKNEDPIIPVKRQRGRPKVLK